MSLIRASIDHRIKNIISWAAIAEIERRFPSGDLLKLWQEKGVRYVTNSRTKQEMPHNYSFYEDYIQHRSLLDIEKATKSLKIPHLIINGMADTAVKPAEAQLLQSWNPKATLMLIDRCGHTFGSKHPWERDELPIFLDQVVEKTIEFIRSQDVLKDHLV